VGKKAKAPKIQRAPRLRDGRREPHGKGWVPALWNGLKAIAEREEKSISWVQEEVMMDYFGLRHSAYYKAKARKAKLLLVRGAKR